MLGGGSRKGSKIGFRLQGLSNLGGLFDEMSSRCRCVLWITHYKLEDSRN